MHSLQMSKSLNVVQVFCVERLLLAVITHHHLYTGEIYLHAYQLSILSPVGY